MNELTVINEQEVLGKQFRIYGDYENPLFLAKDVAEWIAYDISSVNKMLNAVDETEKVRKIVPTPGGPQESWFLTEDGLYEVLMQSRKPIAKQFKKEVKEILKSVRKNGGYIANQENLTSEQILANAVLVAQNIISQKDKEISDMRPKAVFADAVSTAKTSILIGELAKMIRQNGVEMGEKRLFEWLRENGYLVKRRGTDYNAPTQRSMELGLFEVKETAITHSDGHVTISKTTKVTGKGQQYFINKFLCVPV